MSKQIMWLPEDRKSKRDCYRTQPMVFWNSCGAQLPTTKKCDFQGKGLVKKERGCLFKGCTDLE